MNNLKTAGSDQGITDLGVEVFLAYAAAAGPRGEQVQTSSTSTVKALRGLLAQAQITYWECPDPWPLAADPEATISRMTEACDNYLLVLSPRSLADACCLQGLLFALSLNKRIVPVLAEPVPADHLPEPLQTLELIDLRAASYPLGETLVGRHLLQTLHHEADYHQAHTQLLMRALQWERQRRDPALLLHGEELVWYQRWLFRAKTRSHHGPIQLQTLYIVESNRHREQPRLAHSLPWLKRWLTLGQWGLR